ARCQVRLPRRPCVLLYEAVLNGSFSVHDISALQRPSRLSENRAGPPSDRWLIHRRDRFYWPLGQRRNQLTSFVHEAVIGWRWRQAGDRYVDDGSLCSCCPRSNRGSEEISRSDRGNPRATRRFVAFQNVA